MVAPPYEQGKARLPIVSPNLPKVEGSCSGRRRPPTLFGGARRKIEPDLDDYVFTVEVEQWVSQDERVRRRKDPKQPASQQALWRMVKRVCARAGIRELSPHPLRHGFANRFLRESGRDLTALQALMGHSRPDTTQNYTDDLDLDELAEVLRVNAERRHAQASPDLATLAEQTLTLETVLWRRRESNPRSQGSADSSAAGPDSRSGEARESESDDPHKLKRPRHES
jgi:Phage integrase family